MSNLPQNAPILPFVQSPPAQQTQPGPVPSFLPPDIQAAENAVVNTPAASIVTPLLNELAGDRTLIASLQSQVSSLTTQNTSLQSQLTAAKKSAGSTGGAIQAAASSTVPPGTYVSMPAAAIMTVLGLGIGAASGWFAKGWTVSRKKHAREALEAAEAGEETDFDEAEAPEEGAAEESRAVGKTRKIRRRKKK